MREGVVVVSTVVVVLMTACDFAVNETVYVDLPHQQRLLHTHTCTYTHQELPEPLHLALHVLDEPQKNISF